MKKISAAGVVKHLRQLFSNPNNIPKKINSDRGVGELVFFFLFNSPCGARGKFMEIPYYG